MCSNWGGPKGSLCSNNLLTLQVRSYASLRALFLGPCAWAFASESFAIVPFCIYRRTCRGTGSGYLVFISEIFPNLHRAQGQSLGSGTHWVFAALLTLFFPSMEEARSGQRCLWLLLLYDDS